MGGGARSGRCVSGIIFCFAGLRTIAEWRLPIVENWRSISLISVEEMEEVREFSELTVCESACKALGLFIRPGITLDLICLLIKPRRFFIFVLACFNISFVDAFMSFERIISKS